MDIRQGRIKQKNDDGTVRVEDRGKPADFEALTMYGVASNPTDKKCLIIKQNGDHSNEFVFSINNEKKELEENGIMIFDTESDITFNPKEKSVSLNVEKIIFKTKNFSVETDEMKIKGDIELEGDFKMTGDMEITGDTKSTGNTDVTGNVEVKGKLKNIALDTHTHPYSDSGGGGITSPPTPPIG